MEIGQQFSGGLDVAFTEGGSFALDKERVIPAFF